MRRNSIDIADTKSTNTLYRLAFWLAVFTICYNLVEGFVSTFLGFNDETLALFGFGLDSFIETVSGVGVLVMIVRLERYGSFESGHERTAFEISALKVTGWSFYGLSLLLAVTTGINLVTARSPRSTFWGIVVACVSIITMLALVLAKRKVGTSLRSAPILADANCTLVCVYMSVVVLASSFIYEVTHFAYADALGALGIFWFSIKEGRECFEKARGHSCACEHVVDV